LHGVSVVRIAGKRFPILGSASITLLSDVRISSRRQNGRSSGRKNSIWRLQTQQTCFIVRAETGS
jgi:hypothetical protein